MYVRTYVCTSNIRQSQILNACVRSHHVMLVVAEGDKEALRNVDLRRSPHAQLYSITRTRSWNRACPLIGYGSAVNSGIVRNRVDILES
jgi:hypothetical protein